tara:strand:- start:1235 stop:1660 length:426 start_codon:yes stop_codon:yes gene_type:complete
MTSSDEFVNFLKSSLSQKLKDHLMKDVELIDMNIPDLEELISARTDKILSEDIDFSNMNGNSKKSPSRAVSQEDKNDINDIIKNNTSFTLPQENLKRKGTEAYEYYEKYKKATNYTEWIECGARRDHFLYEYRKNIIKLSE